MFSGDGGAPVVEVLGGGKRFFWREMRNRGMNPGREGVPPDIRRVEMRVGRRSIGS